MVRRTRETCSGIEKTKGRYDTIKSQVGWIKKFIPDQNFKIKDITPSLFLNYYTFRKKQTKDKVQNVTLINENGNNQHNL